MKIEEPCKSYFTIYSKSGCTNCTKVKALLKENNLLFNVIDCDEYILEDKDFFLAFIKERANKEYNTFPMVFNHRMFIGGYTETQKYINRLFLYFDETQF
jgi:glutaredoxin